VIELPLGRRIVLASSSPRRAALLDSVGLDFVVRTAGIDETPRPFEVPIDYVRRLSVEKAEAASQQSTSSGEADAGTSPGGGPEEVGEEVIVAADTTVELAGAILGKPSDDADAARILRSLSGRSHHVHTGVTVVTAAGARTIVVTTAVTFVALDEDMVRAYVATGEPRGKAGAYALQGAGGALVERIDGSVTNVIGLPLAETLEMLRTP
jgi:nucleoside triphosphate pyrophosphatase